MIEREEFDAWKQDKVTLAVFEELNNRYNDVLRSLGITAGLDVNEDNRKRGYLQGILDVAQMDLFEDETND